MKVDTYQCDICSTQKREVNHWWKAYRLPEGVTLLSWDAEEPDVFTGDGPAHLCGVQHVIEWLSKRISEMTQ